ncbi:hypothetical protein C0Q44_18045 [Paenibacillus sp. PCH8]|uniref:hypothetical protein n=1 Tax=Paenibacillus sp. PCH8 TaxID=2066524 RepID=UPI000CF845BC|nr:hypothetical protein [Paenibacillus sp. PCH8]PQP81606.1 hypothetical protein C0Q44_18045 [Paenibacillus sp. PCH8]
MVDATIDSVQGFNVLKSMKLTRKQDLADRTYDTNAIRTFLKEQQAIPVIPGKKPPSDPEI